MQSLLQRVRARLVDDWKRAWRWWSMRFNAAGIAVLAFVQFEPGAVLWVWNMMPGEVRRFLPPNFLLWVGLGLFLLSMLSRVVKQEKKDG